MSDYDAEQIRSLIEHPDGGFRFKVHSIDPSANYGFFVGLAVEILDADTDECARMSFEFAKTVKLTADLIAESVRSILLATAIRLKQQED